MIGANLSVAHVIQAVDTFLIVHVLMVFGGGIYLLFLHGKATLYLADAVDLEGANPMKGPGKAVDEFQFDGIRVTVGR